MNIFSKVAGVDRNAFPNRVQKGYNSDLALRMATDKDSPIRLGDLEKQVNHSTLGGLGIGTAGGAGLGALIAALYNRGRITRLAPVGESALLGGSVGMLLGAIGGGMHGQRAVNRKFLNPAGMNVSPWAGRIDTTDALKNKYGKGLPFERYTQG